MKLLAQRLLAILALGCLFVPEVFGAAPYEICQAAMDLLAQGKQVEAEQAVETACKTYPEDQHLLFLRGVMERSRFHKDEAFKTFSAVHALDADTVEGQAALASTSMDFELGVESGLESLRKLIETHPDEILVRWLFAIQCRTHRKYPEDAAEQYRIILEEWNPDPVMVCHTYANILTESLGRPEEALPLRERALSLAQRGWTYQGYANTLRELGRYDEACAAFEKAVEIKPDYATYWRQWGDCLLEAGRDEEAGEVYRKAYVVDSSDTDIMVARGRCCEEGRGRDQEYYHAMAWYEKAAAMGSGKAMYHIGRMKELGRGNLVDYASAVEWYAKSVAAGYERPIQELVKLHVSGGYGLDRNLREAEEWYQKTMDDSPPSTDGSCFFAGLAFSKSRTMSGESVIDYNLSCEGLKRRASAGEYGAQDLLAWMYAANENVSEETGENAVQLAEELCLKDEENPQWRNTLAMAYARTGRYDEALRQQKKALGLLPRERYGQEEGRAYAERLKLYQSGFPYNAYCGEQFSSSSIHVETVKAGKPPGDAFRQGWKFEHGEEGEKDYAAALECYQKEADEGVNVAWQMCMIYQKGGFGVDRSLAKAVECYAQSAADSRVPQNAQYVRVGDLTMRRLAGADGKGVVFQVDYGITLSTCKEAAEHGSEDAKELLAWLYATCAESRYRDAREAVRLAEEFCGQDVKNPKWYNTLAAAYARSKKFPMAVKQQEKAIELLSEKRKASPEGRAYSNRLELYRERKAFPPD